MATLAGQTIASTYISLLKTSSNSPNLVSGSTTERIVLSPDADASDRTPIYVSQDRVGVGTSAPGALLEVRGGSGTGFSGAGELRLSTAEATVTGVGGTDDVLGLISFQAPGEEAGTDAILPAAAIWAQATVANFDADENDAALVFATANSETAIATAQERMRIDSEGNVGIGTTDPANLLTLKSEGDCVINFMDTTDGNAGYIGVAANVNTGGATDMLGLRGQTGIQFSGDNGSSIAMEIDANSNVGIGTDTPTAKLMVYSSSGTVTSGIKGGSLADTNKARCLVWGQKSGGTLRYAAVGVTYNDAVAQAAGYVRMDSHDGTSAYIYLDEDDDLQVSDTSTHIGTTSGQELHDDITSSDERLKEISSDAFPYGLDTINNLSPIKFRYKYKTKNAWKLGLGAQTTQPIVPETVIDTKLSSKFLSEGETRLIMSYSQFIPVLIKAVQELSAKVTALEGEDSSSDTKIAALEAKDTASEAKIVALETEDTANKAKVATLESEDAANKAKITVLEAEDVANKAKIVALETKDTEYATTITSLTDRITVLENA